MLQKKRFGGGGEQIQRADTLRARERLRMVEKRGSFPVAAPLCRHHQRSQQGNIAEDFQTHHSGGCVRLSGVEKTFTVVGRQVLGRQPGSEQQGNGSLEPRAG